MEIFSFNYVEEGSRVKYSIKECKTNIGQSNADW